MTPFMMRYEVPCVSWHGVFDTWEMNATSYWQSPSVAGLSGGATWSYAKAKPLDFLVLPLTLLSDPISYDLAALVWLSVTVFCT
jgi:hypothetical protein